MNLKYFLINLSIYAGGIPCIIGLYNWRALSMTMKSYWVYSFMSFIIGIVSVICAELGIKNHFVYPILAICAGICFGVFYSKSVENMVMKYVILSLYSLAVLYVIYDFLNDSVQFLNLELFLITNVLNLLLSLFLIKQLVEHSVRIKQKPIFWLLLATCFNALYGLVLSQIGGKLALYFGNKFQDVFWLSINPIINFTLIGIVSYAFYLAKNNRFAFDNIPDLEQEP